jgi:hypothetical protein
MKKLLLIFGGVRIGDCFHAIPFLNYVTHEGYQIDWIHGLYTREVVQFLKDHTTINIGETHEFEDGFPTDLTSIRMFRDRIYGMVDTNGYDSIVDDENVIFQGEVRTSGERVVTIQGRRDQSFTFDWNEFADLSLTNEEEIPKLFSNDLHRMIREDPFITVQSSTVSAWKNISELSKVDFPLPVIQLGSTTDQMIEIQDSLNAKGISIAESAYVLSQGKFHVGANSSLACLSVYLNQPLVCCQFSKDVIRFSTLRPETTIDVYPSTQESIQEAIDMMFRETQKGKEGEGRS